MVSHRTWPVPSRRPEIVMNWHDLLFLHWPVKASVLRPLIPPALQVDTLDGDAWIGVVPFRMTGVGPRILPKFRWLSDFAELNVRTYVTIDDKPGVWFFSLDAAQRLACWAARRFFHLSYYYARMKCEPAGDWIEYASERRVRGSQAARFAGRYRGVGPVRETTPGTLEHWLTARYCLYAADRRGRVYRGEIDHPPWPLQDAEAEIRENTMTAPLGLRLPDVTPRMHFAKRIDTVAWTLERVA